MHKKKVLVLIGIYLVLFNPTQASWYGDHNVKHGSDILMLDIMYPYWSESTYFACWNINFNPGGAYFYGGIASSSKQRHEESYRPSSVWSFWPHASYGGRQVRNVYVHPEVNTTQYIGEGASGSAGGQNLSWMKTKQWYTMTLRVWGADSVKKEGYVGWWMKDKSRNEWIHYGTFKIPYPITGINSNAGFLEDYWFQGRDTREIWRGPGYGRESNNWYPCDSISIAVPKDGNYCHYWTVQPKEDGSALSMSFTHNVKFARNLDADKIHYFQLNQPRVPILDKLDFKADARLSGDEIILDWSFGKHSSPQLGYKIEVFDNASLKGTPIVEFSEEVPQIRTKSLKVSKAKRYYVRLTIHDIFDQEKSTIVSEFKKEELILSEKSSVKFIEGLLYNYYEKSEEWTSVDDMATLKPIRSGISDGFDMRLRDNRGDKLGLTFDGYLNVLKRGTYTFVLKSCDGSRLSIGGKIIIDNDGIHSISERRAVVFLEKGAIPISLSYFKNQRNDAYIGLQLEWSSVDFELRAVRGKDLIRKDDVEIPNATIEVLDREGSKFLKGSLSGDNSKRPIKEVIYFNDNKEVGRVTRSPFELKVIPFDGNNNFWCRVRYNNRFTVDSKRIVVTDTSSYNPEWTYVTIGEPDLLHKQNYDGRKFDVVGEGEYFIYKPIKGDFELTARVVDIAKFGSGWLGIMARQQLIMDNNNEIAIFHTPDGLYTSANHSDLGTSRTSSFAMDRSHHWLKITRNGDTFIAYSSKDGKNWVVGYERIFKTPEELYVGVTYLSTPGASDKIFSASLTDLKLRSVDWSKEPQEQKIKSIDGILDDTSVYGYSLLDSTMTLVRYQKGADLIINRDGEYKQRSLKLPKRVNRVRSAIKSGENLLIAASGKKESGIYLSEDWGKSWLKVKDIHFAYRDYVCGEILATNPLTPNYILAGSEKEGVFLSQDGGRNWTLQGLTGESITEVTYKQYADPTAMILTYDEDKDEGAVYQSLNRGESWTLQNRVPLAKFTRLIYGKGAGLNYIGSLAGMYHTYNGCISLFRSVYELPKDQVFFGMDWVLLANERYLLIKYLFAPFGKSEIYRSENNSLLLPVVNEDHKLGLVYELREDLVEKDIIVAYSSKGIFSSKDSGQSWEQLITLKPHKK